MIVGAALLIGLGLVSQRVDGQPPWLEDSRRLGWTSAAESDALAREVFERLNAERAARGAPPLVWDRTLAESAGRWSEIMIESGRFEHSPDGFRAHPDYGTGENIAYGQTTTQELHVGWMKSDGHRLNLLDANYDAVGIGIVCRADGVMWATQVFGRSLWRRDDRAQVNRSVEPIVRSGPGLYCGGRSVPSLHRW